MTSDASSGAKHILLVEDNPGDIRLIQEVFKECGISDNLYVADSGTEAIEFLRRRGRYEQSPRPDLILLDLNMPRIDGFQVLAEIKGDEALRTIPVVVLSSSSAETDIRRAYELNANCYLTKPHDLNSAIELIKSIDGFWLHTARHPGGKG